MLLIFGKSDDLLWIIIGPILFFFVLKTVTPGNSIEWRYQSKPQSGTNTRSYEVSWLFHEANYFISSVSSELIKLFTSTQSQELMSNFMTRERVMSELLTLQIPNGGFRTFATETLFQCSKEMDAARMVALGDRDPLYKTTSEYVDARIAADRYREISTQAGKHLSTKQSKDYVFNVLARTVNGNASDDGLIVLKQCADEGRSFVASNGGAENLSQAVSAPMSCAQLWCWMGLGIFTEVAAAEADIQQRYGLDKATFDKIKFDIAKKLETPKMAVDSMGKRLGDADPVQPDPSLIPVIVGGYLIREMMGKLSLHSPSLAMLTDQTGLHVPEFNFSGNLNEDEMEMVGLANSEHILAITKQFEVLTYIHALPYLQGLILYFTAFSFPFFAILLLIPSRAKSFLLWFGIWAWAKCWDVGWALVMLIEQFLWSMLPHNGMYDPLRDPNHGPISVFDSAFRGDSSFHLATYYVIVGVLLAAVPVLTAQLLLGANASILTPLLNSFERIGAAIGKGANAWTRVEQGVPYERLREAFVGRYVAEHSGDITNPANYSNVNPIIGDIYNNHIKPIEDQANQLEGMKEEEVNLSNVLMALQLSGSAAETRLARKSAVLALRRAANDAKANLVRFNRDLLYYQAGQMDEYKLYDDIRGGVNRRVHPWDKDDSPWGTLRDANQNVAVRDALVTSINSRLDAELQTAIIK